jgi:hypothetical protein
MKLPLLMANRGVEQFRLFMEEFLVSRSRSRASEDSTKTIATSGPNSGASSRKRNRRTRSLKTSPVSLPASPFAVLVDGKWMTPQKSLFQGWVAFSQNFPRTGSMRSGALFPAPPLVLPNCAGESSCSPVADWPTPDANVFQDGHSVNAEEWQARRERLKETAGNGNGCGTPLAMAAQLWQTPRDFSGGGNQMRGGARSDEVTLLGQAELWATPRASDHKGTGRSLSPREAATSICDLPEQVQMWSTPTTQDAENDAPPSAAARNSPPLNLQACHCGLPVQGWVDLALSMTSENFSDATLEALGESIRQNSPIPSAGQKSSPSAPTSRRRLSPKFTAWLQGLPENWTCLGQINSEVWEIWRCRFNAAWRSLTSGIASMRKDES